MEIGPESFFAEIIDRIQPCPCGAGKGAFRIRRDESRNQISCWACDRSTGTTETLDQAITEFNDRFFKGVNP